MKPPALVGALLLYLLTVLAHFNITSSTSALYFTNALFSPLALPDTSLPLHHIRRRHGYTIRCETTHASPSTVHVLFTAEKLLGVSPSDLCTQYNIGGSRCTQLVSGATAAVAICAGWSIALQCRMVGHMVAELCEECSFRFSDRIERTGGQITWHEGRSKIVVYHT
ncbi:hypothetical protein Q9L58_001441 [Maublancomyces gigas]|uniref:Uncharacterized protein n=1 Tax=Discina gigas TaxID=1032678 RepID=A0ABR3GVJ7_9PEZI